MRRLPVVAWARPVEEDEALGQVVTEREGIQGLSAENNNSKPPEDSTSSRKGRKARKGAGTDEVGKALRSAYDEALREEVPDDFLDLLGKLS